MLPQGQVGCLSFSSQSGCLNLQPTAPPRDDSPPEEWLPYAWPYSPVMRDPSLCPWWPEMAKHHKAVYFSREGIFFFLFKTDEQIIPTCWLYCALHPIPLWYWCTNIWTYWQQREETSGVGPKGWLGGLAVPRVAALAQALPRLSIFHSSCMEIEKQLQWLQWNQGFVSVNSQSL